MAEFNIMDLDKVNLGNLIGEVAKKAQNIDSFLKNNYNLDTSNSNTVNGEAETINLSGEDLTEIDVPSNDWIYGDDARGMGEFGGNQGSLTENMEELLTDPQVQEIVDKYYPDADKEDLELLFNKIQSVGCGYVASTNTVLLEYIFRSSEEFKEKFGFDLYELEQNENGKFYKDFNYEYLLLDFFLYYAKNARNFETIEDVYGNIEEEMKAKGSGDQAVSGKFDSTGMKGTDLNEVGGVLKEYLAEKGIELDVSHGKVELKEGSPEYEEAKRALEEKGIEVPEHMKLYSKDLTKEIVRKVMNNDACQIVVSGSDFDLYSPKDLDGNGLLDDVVCDDVGGHAMCVVGTTSDPSKVVVSSWGKMYVMNFEDVRDYVIYDYHR